MTDARGAVALYLLAIFGLGACAVWLIQRVSAAWEAISDG